MTIFITVLGIIWIISAIILMYAIATAEDDPNDDGNK